MKKRVAVIGLDCAAPELVFSSFWGELPNIRRLAEGGIYGQMRSSDPPITVPAWTCMLASKDPGQLGIYGFRNRKDYSYSGLSLANAQSIRVDRVWDILGRNGKHVIVLGVPPSYPPSKVNGQMVGCFLTPDTTSSRYTHPESLKDEIRQLVGRYKVDVEDFRTDDRDRILSDIYEMTDQHFTLAEHLLKTQPWDFFAMVEIGLDRLHHSFWRFHDPTHPKHEPGHRYQNAVRDYYLYLDQRVGRLLALFDDQTAVFVVSDHGAQKMEGGICVNEWLMREGYLSLTEQPQGITPFASARIDWSRTRAWGEGGYYSRMFLNVKGREPEGVIEPAEYEAVRDELIEKLTALADPQGRNIGTRVYRPEELWRERNGIPPDLIVYFGNLAWRSVGSIGHGAIHTFENDTGPDDANHAQDGIFILNGQGANGGPRAGLQIYDVAPTILAYYGLKVPTDMIGVSVLT